MPSLYDRYQLSNSTAIPVYQGSAGKEAIAVADYMQGLYDKNLGTALAINAADDNLAGHSADTAIISETKKYYKDKLAELSKSGDWENMMPQTQQLASSFANDASAISAITQKRAEVFKEIDDNKEYNYTGPMKAKLKQMSEDEYATGNTKLTRDGSGKLVGSYQGTVLSKNIDVPKKVDELMKSAADQSGGTITENTDGKWMEKVGNKWEIMKPERVQAIISAGLSLDQEFQGYTDMMGRISSHGLDRAKDPSQVTNETLRNKAIELAKSQGIPFGQALKQIVKSGTVESLLSTALSYGTLKYAKNNLWTEQSKTADPYWLKSTSEGGNDPRIIGVGPNTSTFEWEQNYDEVINNKNKVEATLTDLTEKEAILSKALQDATAKGAKDAITQAEINLSRIRDEIRATKALQSRSEGILNYTRDQAVAQLKIQKPGGGTISSYQELVDAKRPKLIEEISKQRKDGEDGVSNSEIADIILSGSPVKTMKIATGGNSGGPTYTTKNYVIRNGRNIFIPIVPQDQDLKKTNDLVPKIYKQTSKNYSVKSDAIGFDAAEIASLNRYTLAGAKIYKQPGSLEIDDDAATSSMEIVKAAYMPQTKRITATLKAADGTLIERDLKFDSNMPKILAQRIREKSAGDNSAVLSALEETGLPQAVTDMRPNETMYNFPGTDTPLKMFTGKDYKIVNIQLDNTGTNPEWVLRNDDGTVVTTKKNGKPVQFRTSNIEVVHQWLKQFKP